jgi:hypothetical protein
LAIAFGLKFVIGSLEVLELVEEAIALLFCWFQIDLGLLQLFSQVFEFRLSLGIVFF